MYFGITSQVGILLGVFVTVAYSTACGVTAAVLAEGVPAPTPWSIIGFFIAYPVFLMSMLVFGLVREPYPKSTWPEFTLVIGNCGLGVWATGVFMDRVSNWDGSTTGTVIACLSGMSACAFVFIPLILSLSLVIADVCGCIHWTQHPLRFNVPAPTLDSTPYVAV